MIRLVFLGDIGIDGSAPVDLAALPRFDDADLVVANLEGAILSDADRAATRRRRTVAVHNDPAVLDVLRATGVDAVGLANNHAFDYEAPIATTLSALRDAGIEAFGAGRDLAEAAAPLVLHRGDTTVKVFGFGWEMIGCRAATARRSGVSPLRPTDALEAARGARGEDPDVFLVFQMHWNYELELYPQPAHRQLAHDLIRAGADAVIGGHPHVAGGVEVVDGKPVGYSLGNWLFPPRDVDGFAVAYPPVSRHQLALELVVEGREVRDVVPRWYDFDPDTLRIEPASARELTPYAGLGHAEYVEWFRSHRTRSKGLPVYTDYRASMNAGRDTFLRLRQGAGELLARLGLKREQRSARGGGGGEGGD